MEKEEINTDEIAKDLIKVLKKAIRQSKDTLLRMKKKTVMTEYDEELKKPMTEVVEESEEVRTLKGTVDINALKTITALLKEILDIQEGKGLKDTDGDDSGGVIVLAKVRDEENEEK